MPIINSFMYSNSKARASKHDRRRRIFFGFPRTINTFIFNLIWVLLAYKRFFLFVHAFGTIVYKFFYFLAICLFSIYKNTTSHFIQLIVSFFLFPIGIFRELLFKLSINFGQLYAISLDRNKMRIQFRQGIFHFSDFLIPIRLRTIIAYNVKLLRYNFNQF